MAVEKLAMLFKPRSLRHPAPRDPREKLVAVWKLVDYQGGAQPPGTPLPHATILFTRRGRFIRYAVDVESMRRLLTYLTEDCCQGRPELCGGAFTAPSRIRHDKEQAPE